MTNYRNSQNCPKLYFPKYNMLCCISVYGWEMIHYVPLSWWLLYFPLHTQHIPKKVRDSPPKVTFNGPSESTIATLIETDDFGDLESWHHRQISLKQARASGETCLASNCHKAPCINHLKSRYSEKWKSSSDDTCPLDFELRRRRS